MHAELEPTLSEFTATARPLHASNKEPEKIEAPSASTLAPNRLSITQLPTLEPPQISPLRLTINNLTHHEVTVRMEYSQRLPKNKQIGCRPPRYPYQHGYTAPHDITLFTIYRTNPAPGLKNLIGITLFYGTHIRQLDSALIATTDAITETISLARKDTDLHAQTVQSNARIIP